MISLYFLLKIKDKCVIYKHLFKINSYMLSDIDFSPSLKFYGSITHKYWRNYKNKTVFLGPSRTYILVLN